MHFHLEVVMPPGLDAQSTVELAMNHFLPHDGDGEPQLDATAEWWDWWEIGGRWASAKLTASLGKEDLARFWQEIKDLQVTVSPVRMGKERLEPPEQAEKVDAVWRKHFPGRGIQCPFYEHGVNSDEIWDICPVSRLSHCLSCHRLIVVGYYDRGGNPERRELDVLRMLAVDLWNGVEHQKTRFEGNVVEGIRMIRDGVDHFRQVDIGPDWDVVTVDYHN